jgi:hypothetical protein
LTGYKPNKFIRYKGHYRFSRYNIKATSFIFSSKKKLFASKFLIKVLSLRPLYLQKSKKLKKKKLSLYYIYTILEKIIVCFKTHRKLVLEHLSESVFFSVKHSKNYYEILKKSAPSFKRKKKFKRRAERKQKNLFFVFHNKRRRWQRLFVTFSKNPLWPTFFL